MARAKMSGVEWVSVSDLVADPSNVRRHDERNLESIKGSLVRFGQQKPIVVSLDGVVVAGNGTLEAAKRLGWDKIGVIKTRLKGSDQTAFAIADNRTSELASWDDGALADQLSALAIDDADLFAATGFDSAELESLISDAAGDVVEDEVPPVPVNPITQVGDIWHIGTHRLMCGDSTSTKDVATAMAGERADLWLTDPPYNVNYVGKTKDALTIDNDSMSSSEYQKFLVGAFEVAFGVMKPGASFYLWHADTEGYNVRGAVVGCGELVRQCLIWSKSSMVMGRQDYHWQHEPCLYGWKSGAAHGWYSDRTQTTVLEFARPDKSLEHPTMKPVALFAYLIGNSTAPQGLVLDTFMGSGTTLIAAEQLGRRCVGIEISPAYCDVIVERWQKMTGNKAKRLAGGKAA